jgi:hypothetical protein
MLGVLEVWYEKDGGVVEMVVEMVLGGGRALIPSRQYGRFNDEKCYRQGDFFYSQSEPTAVEGVPIMLTCLCQFCCCHRESCAERRH